jgi:hypothetical protein
MKIVKIHGKKYLNVEIDFLEIQLLENTTSLRRNVGVKSYCVECPYAIPGMLETFDAACDKPVESAKCYDHNLDNSVFVDARRTKELLSPILKYVVRFGLAHQNSENMVKPYDY